MSFLSSNTRNTRLFKRFTGVNYLERSLYCTRIFHGLLIKISIQLPCSIIDTYYRAIFIEYFALNYE